MCIICLSALICPPMSAYDELVALKNISARYRCHSLFLTDLLNTPAAAPNITHKFELGGSSLGATECSRPTSTPESGCRAKVSREFPRKCSSSSGLGNSSSHPGSSAPFLKFELRVVAREPRSARGQLQVFIRCMVEILYLTHSRGSEDEI